MKKEMFINEIKKSNLNVIKAQTGLGCSTIALNICNNIPLLHIIYDLEYGISDRRLIMIGYDLNKVIKIHPTHNKSTADNIISHLKNVKNATVLIDSFRLIMNNDIIRMGKIKTIAKENNLIVFVVSHYSLGIDSNNSNKINKIDHTDYIDALFDNVFEITSENNKLKLNVLKTNTDIDKSFDIEINPLIQDYNIKFNTEEDEL